MKWIRVLLPVLLVMGLLLGVSSIAYADDPPDEGLDVDIVIVGDNPDVDIDIIGEDADVTVNTTGTDIWINGQNINEPTVIRYSSGDSGVSKGWVSKRINRAVESLYAWAGDSEVRLSLFADGLAKVILTIGNQDSQLDETSADIDELYAGSDAQSAQLESLDSELASLEREHGALVNEVRTSYRALLFEMKLMEWEHNRNLVIMAGVFMLMVIGLGVSILRLRRRL